MTEQLVTPTTDLVPAEVRAFVGRVREHLIDLDPEEQQELASGLEADLAELVAERGPGVLGDPVAYARELRSAAGHPPEMIGWRRGRGVRGATSDAIDATRARWERLLDSMPGDAIGFLTAVQPVWWVARAWAAWVVAQELRGPYVVVASGFWLVVLAAFVVVSVQIGRRTWGVGRLLDTSVSARLVLVALNLFAVTMLPGAADRTAWHFAETRAGQVGRFSSGEVDEVNPAVITYQGGQACVLEVHDARGRPIPGATVWDATGQRPLPMNTEAC